MNKGEKSMVGVQCAYCGKRDTVQFDNVTIKDVQNYRYVSWNVRCSDCGAEGEVNEVWKNDVVNFKCNKCGKEIKYKPNDEFVKQSCWTIDLGKAGYGSLLDGVDIKFGLCDKCLYEFVSSFAHKLCD